MIVTMIMLFGGAMSTAQAWSGDHSDYPGTSAATRTETIVGLGDSVTSGFRADFSYVQALAESLATADTATQADNYGVAGLTTGWLSAQLSLPTTQASLARAQVVVITIGANDFTVEDADNPRLTEQLAGMRAEVDQILTRVHQYAPDAQVVLTGYWNAFADASVTGADQAYTDRAMGLTRQINEQLQQAAATGGARYVDLGAAFQVASPDWSTLLADDGDHPNDAGQQAIASAIVKALADPNRD